MFDVSKEKKRQKNYFLHIRNQQTRYHANVYIYIYFCFGYLHCEITLGLRPMLKYSCYARNETLSVHAVRGKQSTVELTS